MRGILSYAPGLWTATLLTATASGAVGITLNPPGYGPSGFFAVSGGASESGEITALPYSRTAHLTAPSGSTDVSYELSDSSFLVTFQHAADGTAESGGGSNALVWFSPDEDVHYAMSGEHQAIGPGDAVIQIQAYLTDWSGGPVQFAVAYDNLADPGAGNVFTIGSEPGATGVLTAGHVYLFSYDATLQPRDPGPDAQPIAGGGFMRLTLVPEPRVVTQLILLGLALASSRGAARRILVRDDELLRASNRQRYTPDIRTP
jgi:hypothetical protein